LYSTTNVRQRKNLRYKAIKSKWACRFITRMLNYSCVIWKKIWHAEIERKLCQEKSVLPFPQTWSLNRTNNLHIPREREFPSYLISINSFYRYRYCTAHSLSEFFSDWLHSVISATHCPFSLAQVTLNMPSYSIKKMFSAKPSSCRHPLWLQKLSIIIICFPLPSIFKQSGQICNLTTWSRKSQQRPTRQQMINTMWVKRFLWTWTRRTVLYDISLLKFSKSRDILIRSGNRLL
jgi:hypothetical protein